MNSEHIFLNYLNECSGNPGLLRRLYRHGLQWNGEEKDRWIRYLSDHPRFPQGKQLRLWIAQYDSNQARQRYKKLLQRGVFMLTYRDNQYPQGLRHLPDPPVLLYGKGNSGCLEAPATAIVGARKCSCYGRNTAYAFSKKLAEEGVTIVSGLARGIDTWSHRGALDGKGQTIAVLGSGLGQIYPPENRSLAQEIASQGLLLSEYAPETGPKKLHFPERNRIISGLSRKLLVVEATHRSGSLITAGFALEQGIDVYAVPGNIDQETSQGTNRLIADGAQPALDFNDIMDR